MKIQTMLRAINSINLRPSFPLPPPSATSFLLPTPSVAVSVSLSACLFPLTHTQELSRSWPGDVVGDSERLTNNFSKSCEQISESEFEEAKIRQGIGEGD
jgi:hypothetical protein